MTIEKSSPSLFSGLRRPAITLALVVASALGLRGSTAEQHHALLSSDLFAHKAKQTKARTRVVVNVSFVTGDSSVLDAFGHGTHVAGIIAGSGDAAASVTSLYTGGIAPDVKLVNVRVLGANGTGLTSDVIAGIDWAINHKTTYNIRVINLSLGHPVFERSSTDPLCVEVQKAVNAGIVVVASAGNS